MLDEIIVNSMIELVQEMFKGLKFDYKVEGLITKVIDSNTYEVKIQNNIEIIQSMNANEYLVDDVVYITVFNNNYSDKKILCKK